MSRLEFGKEFFSVLALALVGLYEALSDAFTRIGKSGYVQQPF